MLDDAWRAPRSRSAGGGDVRRRAPPRRAARPPRPRRSGRSRGGTWPPRRSSSAAPVSVAPRPARRSAKLGAARLDQSVVRSPRASAASRFGAHDHGPLLAAPRARAAGAGALGRARGPRAPRRPAAGPRARRRARPRAITSRSSTSRDVRDDQRAAGRPWPAAPRRPGRRRRPAACSGGAGCAASAATASSRPGSRAPAGPAAAAGAPPAGRLVHADAEQVGGEAVGDLDRALGERRLGVAARGGPRRALRSGPSRSKASHHVGRRDAVALEQVADEPRARQLARDVVLQVGVEAAVARVELRRGADGEHRGVEQVEPERGRRLGEAVVGVRHRLARA